MSKPPSPGDQPHQTDRVWDFEGARHHHLEIGRSLTPEQRLRWLEETMEEMRGLQGLARKGRPVSGP